METVSEIILLEQEIENIIKQLDKWQKESLTGGWSTHQVVPMQNYANRLRKILNRKKRDYEQKRSNSLIENL